MNQILQEIHTVMLDKQTEKIVFIEVGDRCVFTDFFVIGQCRTSRHLITVCDALIGWAKLNKNSFRMQGRGDETTWIVIDLGVVFVHLFLEGTRQVFDLESLWGDAKFYPTQGVNVPNPSYCPAPDVRD